MAELNTYVQLRQAEDVVDEIYVISPVDNPCAAMARTVRATGKLHEWTQDALLAAAANRAIEGADAPAAAGAAVVERSNYCQIMTKAASITGTLEEVDKYGRDSEMAYQLQLRYGELANDEELAIVGAPGGTRQVGTAGAAGTARQMTSIHTQLDASVIISATGITTIPQLETKLLDAHQATFTAGGNPNYLFVAPAKARFVSSFALAAGRTRELGNERTLVNVVDMYVSNFGEMDVVIDRNQDTVCMLLLDFNYLATPVLRPTRDWAIAKTGDKDTRQILRESTFAVLNSKAHAMVDAIPASLTLA